MLATGLCSEASAARPHQSVRPLSAAALAGLIAACCLAWLIGVGMQLVRPELPESGTLVTGLIVAGFLLLTGSWPIAVRHVSSRAAVVVCLACALLLPAGLGLLGWAVTGAVAEQRLAQRLVPSLESVDIVVTGVVSDLPQVGSSGLRFEFKPEAASRSGQRVSVPPRLAIGWYFGREDDATMSPLQQSLRAGQRWRFTLRLRRPHGSLNPHGHDFELYLFERGIGATGYVRDTPQRPQLLADGLGFRVARLRQSVREAIQQHVADARAAGVLAALAVGDQGAIDRDDWQLFRNTGVAHLVAISGLHITMFSWLASMLIGAAWRLSPRATLWIAAPHAGRWGGLGAAAVYAAVAGWGVPAQRTLLMLALVVVLNSLGRRWPWPMVLLVAAVLVTALDPWALLQPGFWLSFVAVGLLLATDEAAAARVGPKGDATVTPRWIYLLRQVLSRFGQQIRSQMSISLGLAPLSMIFFQQLSVVGVLANLLAIPLVTLFITPLALLGIAAPWLWQPAAWLLQILAAVLAWLASWPFAVWTVAAAPSWAQLAAMTGAVLAVMPLPRRLRLLAIPLLVPLVLPPVSWPAAGRFEAMAIDVGQGTGVLVRTRSHLLLFDTGPQYSRDSDAGQRILLPLLRGRGERRIDRLLLSHRDNDHVGGASSLIEALPVDELLASLEDGHVLLRRGIASRRCEAGQTWQWDGVFFEILHPLASDYATPRKSNAMSCVLRVAGSAPGSGSLLITGDIERQQELEILARAAGKLRSTVLIVPHHGSRTSSTAGFIDAVEPRVAVFQAGYRNRFGHPAPDVVDAYRKRGIEVIESSRCGAWWWQDSALERAVCERVRAKRHWHDRSVDDAVAPQLR